MSTIKNEQILLYCHFNEIIKGPETSFQSFVLSQEYVRNICYTYDALDLVKFHFHSIYLRLKKNKQFFCRNDKKSFEKLFISSKYHIFWLSYEYFSILCDVFFAKKFIFSCLQQFNTCFYKVCKSNHFYMQHQKLPQGWP